MMKPPEGFKPYEWVLFLITFFLLIPGPAVAVLVLYERIPNAGVVDLVALSLLALGTYGWLFGCSSNNIEWMMRWWRRR